MVITLLFQKVFDSKPDAAKERISKLTKSEYSVRYMEKKRIKIDKRWYKI